jgi:hypothetical protein
MSPVRVIETATGMTMTLAVGRPLPPPDKPAGTRKA